jgi:hypothetical protein
MKKKLRSIIVDSKEYLYSVLPVYDDNDGSVLIRIFKDKKLLVREFHRGEIIVTPKYVEQLIKNSYNES